jgi:aminomethyltransferase
VAVEQPGKDGQENQAASGPGLGRTKLFSWHAVSGARMLGFGGWEMPVQYAAGPREEHQAVRRAAGLFDIDHMGRLTVEGPDALALLQKVQSWDVSTLPPGAAHYSLLCTPAGGIVDDIFVYRLPDGGGWLVIVNAANCTKDREWILSHRGSLGAEVRDVSADTCMLALQGPASAAVLEELGCRGAAGMGWHRVSPCEIGGAACTLCTTGYTGEPGFEILVPAAAARRSWEALLQAGSRRGVMACGLAARDSLRAEACLPLYGHEISEDTDPFSAGLGAAAVSMDHEFIGKQALAALMRSAPVRRLVGFSMTEAAVPRQGYAIRSPSGAGENAGRVIGSVTTGLFSPSTGAYVGMGYVHAPYAGVGTALEIVIRGAGKAARVVRRPFYRSPHWSGGKGR